MNRRRALMTGRKSRNILNCIRTYDVGDTGIDGGGYASKDKDQVVNGYSRSNSYAIIYPIFGDGRIKILKTVGNGAGVQFTIKLDGKDFCISWTNPTAGRVRTFALDANLTKLKTITAITPNPWVCRYTNLPAGTVYAVISFDAAVTAGYEYSNIMVNWGTTPLPYEPYGAKPKSDNLFDIYTLAFPNASIGENGLLTITGGDGSAWSSKPQISLKAGLYVLSCENLDVTMELRTPDGATIASGKGIVTFSVANDITVGAKLTAASYPQECYVQLEKGQAATEYRPFVPTT